MMCTFWGIERLGDEPNGAKGAIENSESPNSTASACYPKSIPSLHSRIRKDGYE